MDSLKPIRAAVYVRVSTFHKNEEGKAKSQDPAMQKREIQAYLKSKGIEAYEVYEDKGYSGTKDSRPALKRLMADCRAGRVQMVVCWKLDRLFRSLRHLINTLDEFTDLGIQFVALRDSIDLSTHTGRFMMQILGAVAEFEVAVIRERTNAGLDNARAKGVRLGRKPKPLDLERVRALLADGATHEAVARLLGVSTKKIQRGLSRA